MQKSVVILKALLAGCIGLFVIIIVLNLALGKIEGAMWTVFPLLSGLYAFFFIGRANWASVKCPSCATQQPFWRWPSSFRQLMWGGWTCTNCGTEMDRNGKPVDQNTVAH